MSSFQQNAFQSDAFQIGAIQSGGGGDVTVTPGVGSLTLTGFAATLTASSSTAPGLVAVTLTGQAATVAAGSTASPGLGTLTLAGQAATVAASASAAPGLGSLTLTGLSASVAASGSVEPVFGALTLTGYEPTVSASGSVTLTPETGVLDLIGFVPTVTAEASEAAGGGMSGRGQVQYNRPRPHPAHIWELELAQAARLASIAKKMASSERPQAKRIARKLEDYTGEMKQAESLRRELAKLEAAQRERQFRSDIERQKSEDLRDAARELDAILADDEDVIDLLIANYEVETNLMLSVFGIGRLI